MVSMAKSILVATDLSARSDRAIDRAAMLAAQWETRLAVIHVLEPGSKLESDPKAAEQVIRTVLPNPQADVDIVPEKGSAPSTIVQTATSLDCGLIVTGVARFNHLGDYFVGTAVDHIIRHASAPVLVVKQRPHEPYRSILVATDHSSCSLHALLTAARLFPDAAIHLVNAYHVPYEGWLRSQEVKDEVTREAQAELDAFVQDAAIPESLRVRLSSSIGFGETHTVVWNEVEKVGADLVVLGTHGRTGFVPAVIGSMAESLLRCVPCDTLMVREPS